MKKVKRIDENKNEIVFDNIKEAAKSVDTKMELWKVEMFIGLALQNKRKAFKYIWKKV